VARFIFDEVDITITTNYGWTVIGYNVTLSYSGTFQYDSTEWSGVATLNTTGGGCYQFNH
jgi:hypothetical protein